MKIGIQENFSEEFKKEMIIMIQHVRPFVRIDDGMMINGTRFNSDDRALSETLEHIHFNEINDLKMKKMAIIKGLKECASADYWYTFEKEW